MKSLLFGGLTIISYFGGAISFIWAIVEFILYLVKDKEFNWWSVWCIIIFSVLSILFFILSTIVYSKIIEKRKTVNFNDRLEEIRKNRIRL